MYRITYHPKEGDFDTTKVGAHEFRAGEPVLVDEQHHQTPWTLMNNPWFTVEKVEDEEKDNA